MDEVRPTPEQIRRWVEQAEWDLGTARHNVEGERYDAAVLYCQQAAEKMLKAAYMAVHHEEAARTHSLQRLLRDLGGPPQLIGLGRALTSDYIITRYPGAGAQIPAKAYGRAQAEDRLRRAEEIIAWAQQLIEEAAGECDG
ncbi:MAG: HEPN domain-containing protein [Armatimonadota bacterium]|jgi:HEPN domain-containing protein